MLVLLSLLVAVVAVVDVVVVVVAVRSCCRWFLDVFVFWMLVSGFVCVVALILYMRFFSCV